MQEMEVVNGGCVSWGGVMDIVNYLLSFNSVNYTLYLFDGYGTGCYNVAGGGYIDGVYVGGL